MKTGIPQSSDSAKPQPTQRFEPPPPDLLAPAPGNRESGVERLNPDKAWERWKTTGSETDFHTVVQSLDPTVRKGLGAFAGGREHLLTKARLLAADAVQTYDPDKVKGPRASLSTHVYSNLQRLQRVAADREAAVRLPERSRMDAIAIRDAAREWEDAHGYEPDLATLGDLTGLSPGRIRLAGRAFREISMAGMTGEKGDTLLDSEAKADEDSWRDYVYIDLDPKSRKIFEWTTGYGGSKTLAKTEIAKRLHMTPAAVSSRIGTIVKRLEARPSGSIV